jgi:protein-S-isoprenylcysteine O-methyltransferase Ste14
MRRAPALALSALAWLVGVPLAHGAIPWALSLVGPRFGWSDGRPSSGNWLGLIPVALGCALLAWVAATSFSRVADLPETLELNWVPKVFLTSGPYAHTRNPMYVGELALWLGWATMLGSLPVLCGAVVLGLAMRRAVRREERALEASYGDPYRRYSNAVPRWLGHVRSR